MIKYIFFLNGYEPLCGSSILIAYNIDTYLLQTLYDDFYLFRNLLNRKFMV